jgi:hypothetical protein
MRNYYDCFLKSILSTTVVTVFIFIAFFLTVRPASAATNISSTAHWAWNDSIGWMDFYSNLNVYVSSTATTTGYASSSARDISLDCATTRGGNICITAANYGVYNPGSGKLTGWGWNDVYGWISFDCNNVPGGCSSPYEVQIDPVSGDFSGWAWNDVIGWFSFNCKDPPPSGICGTSPYKVNTTWTATSTFGYLDSSTYDTGVAGGAELNSIVWQGPPLPNGTSVKFQIAASNSPSGPWNSSNFVGYDGTSNTYYPKTGLGTPGTSIPLDYFLHNNQRYFRYRVTLVSDQAEQLTPTVNSIIINWSP